MSLDSLSGPCDGSCGAAIDLAVGTYDVPAYDHMRATCEVGGAFQSHYGVCLRCLDEYDGDHPSLAAVVKVVISQIWPQLERCGWSWDWHVGTIISGSKEDWHVTVYDSTEWFYASTSSQTASSHITVTPERISNVWRVTNITYVKPLPVSTGFDTSLPSSSSSTTQPGSSVAPPSSPASTSRPNIIVAAAAGGAAGIFLILILVILWVYRQSIKRRRTRKLEADPGEKSELDGDAILPTRAQEMGTDRGRVEAGGTAIHEMGLNGLAFELDATERKEELPRYSSDVTDRPRSSRSLAISPSEAGVA